MTTGLNSTGKNVSGGTGAVVLTRYVIADAYGTAIYNGDPVVVDATSGCLVICPESLKPTGILRGIMYIDATNKELRFLNYYPASTTNAGTIDGETNVVALVEDIAGKEFYIEISDAAIAQTDIGDNKRLKTTGTQVGVTGRSAAVVDMDATVTSELRLVKILGLQQTPDPRNVYGSTNADVRVQFV